MSSTNYKSGLVGSQPVIGVTDIFGVQEGPLRNYMSVRTHRKKNYRNLTLRSRVTGIGTLQKRAFFVVLVKRVKKGIFGSKFALDVRNCKKLLHLAFQIFPKPILFQVFFEGQRRDPIECLQYEYDLCSLCGYNFARFVGKCER